MYSSLLTASLALLPLVAALPKVTPKLLTGGCSALPKYDSQWGSAGPWSVIASSATSKLNDHGLTAIVSRGPKEEIRWGYIGALDVLGQATNPLRCTEEWGIEALVPTVVSSLTWEKVVVVESPQSALLMYKTEGSPIEPYAHYIDGVKQNGTYLGSKGTTSWGFTRVENKEQGFYWEIRLLGEGSGDPVTEEPLRRNEIAGFLKIYEY